MKNLDHHNRFLVHKDNISISEFRISGEEVRHIKVKRLRKGDVITGLDGSGVELKGSFERIEGSEIICRLIEKIHHPPPKRKIFLAVGIIKSGGMSLICEKAAEFGIIELLPVYCEHSNRHLNPKEIEHLNRVGLSGMKQSGGFHAARVGNETVLTDILHEYAGVKMWIADQDGIPALDIEFEDDSIIFIGPEGGFSDAEIEQIESAGGKKFSLGEFRLRSETAAIAASIVFSMKLSIRQV